MVRSTTIVRLLTTRTKQTEDIKLFKKTKEQRTDGFVVNRTARAAVGVLFGTKIGAISDVFVKSVPL